MRYLFKHAGACSVLVFLFTAGIVRAQIPHSEKDGTETVSILKIPDCTPKDLLDVIFKRKPDLQDTIERLTTLFVPYMAYSPSTGFLFGLGGNFSFRLGKRDYTNLSAANASIELTTEKQVILQMKSNIFAGHNQWFLQGDWRYYLFNIPTFGVGTGNSSPLPKVPGIETDPDEESSWDDAYRVKFHWFRFHEVLSRQIIPNLYAGIGFHLDHHFDIQDNNLVIDSGKTKMTPHYAYSTLHGFNPKQYTVSGLSLNFVYDSRDNLINPYHGIYFNVNYRDFFRWMGSDKEGSQFWAEFRTYLGLEKKIPRHLLAFWLYGSFQVSGQIPYFDLRATGFDQMNSSGRGYIQGRWRGEQLVYGEVEYRFPITRCSQVLGGAIFLNATTASSKDLGTPLFGYIRPAGGFGLRIMVSRKSRTNILIDFAIGALSRGIFAQAQEAF